MLWVGTSGWQYDSWRGRFYPQHLATTRWLPHYARRFPTVEVNNTFYRLPERPTFERWAAETPEGFLFACKLSRYLTHVRRLRDPDEAVGRFLDRAAGLGDRLGPLLLQLPPTLGVEPDRLAATLAAFPPSVRVAVELRHVSWFSEEVAAVLHEHGAALCWSDRHSRLLSPLWRTTDWVYVRLHEGTARPRPSYGRRALESWIRRIGDATDGEGYVYFNNDANACAPRNAAQLATLAARSGLPVTTARNPVRQ
ncbi:MAG: DUF72 domain-containing protein [Acidimicrobiales bacterium]